jgi:predicted lipid-binding transport protein (Tim44 family)
MAKHDPFAPVPPPDPDADKTYVSPDPHKPGFVTETRSGDVREATPEEVEAVTEEWEQHRKDGVSQSIRRYPS